MNHLQNQTNWEELLNQTAKIAADYLNAVNDNPVSPTGSHDELLTSFGGPIPEQGTDHLDVLRSLVDAAESGLLHTAGSNTRSWSWGLRRRTSA